MKKISSLSRFVIHPVKSSTSLKGVFTVSAFILSACLSASAQVITPTSLGNLTTMPGSATDFTLFGNSTQFPTLNNNGGDFGNQPTVLHDFVIAVGADATNTYGGNSGAYSVINAPVGSGDTGVTTGILYNNSSSGTNLVDFTLGKPGSTFNFSDFNVYVMYGNAHDGYEIDTSIDATLLSPAGPDQMTLTSSSPTVIDSNASKDGNYTEATFEEFTIKGASAGDVLQLGAGGWGYLGGVSFLSVPEPSTYAMMLGGLALLGVLIRRKSALVK
jgi:hypothetical protein